MPGFTRLLSRRAIPWTMLLEVAMLARERWGRLEPGDRAKLSRIVRESRGRPGNVSAKDKDELRRLVGQLDLMGIPRDLSPFGRGRGRRR